MVCTWYEPLMVLPPIRLHWKIFVPPYSKTGNRRKLVRLERWTISDDAHALRLRYSETKCSPTIVWLEKCS